MGLMAVGTVAFIDPQSETDDADDQVEDIALPPTPASIGDTASDTYFGDEDFFDEPPASDPRGGDDAVDLGPLFQDPAQMVVVVEGSEDNDRIEGGDGHDRITTGPGLDEADGGAGNDELRGVEGPDTLRGGAGHDTLHGGDGTDVLHGDDGNDALFGHNDDDTLWGDDGDDTLQGSAGDDLLRGGSGHDALHGGLDDDTLTGGAGNDTLFGGWGDDRLSGVLSDTGTTDADRTFADGADFLNGGGGADTIIAGAGDVVTAGNGADQIVLGDWIIGEANAQIIDYSAEEDSLLLVWDDAVENAVAPTVEVATDPDDAGRCLVMMDGTVIASVNGGDLSANDVSLLPLSAAQTLGLAP